MYMISNFHGGGIIIDSDRYLPNEYLKDLLEEEFGEFKYAVKYALLMSVSRTVRRSDKSGGQIKQ